MAGVSEGAPEGYFWRVSRKGPHYHKKSTQFLECFPLLNQDLNLGPSD